MTYPFQTFYIKVNHIDEYMIYYPPEKASEQAVLFLHGGPGESSAPFLYLSQPKTRSYHFFYYDQRGTGRTQLKNKNKPFEVNIEMLLRDLDETIAYIKQNYKVEQVILLGHSWGTVLGVEYLKKYGSTVAAYIGMGQVVGFKKGERCAYEHCLEIVKKNGDKKDLDKLKQLGDYQGNDFTLDQLKRFRNIQMKYHLAGMEGGTGKMLALMKKSPVFHWKDLWVMISSMKVNQQLFDFIFDYDTSEFVNYPVPVYFICGRQDWQVPSIVAASYFEQVKAPDKSIYWIENAGHSTDMDQPETFNKTVEEIVLKSKFYIQSAK